MGSKLIYGPKAQILVQNEIEASRSRPNVASIGLDGGKTTSLTQVGVGRGLKTISKTSSTGGRASLLP